MIHFTSDTHYFHKNIIKYCNRPFTDIREMNETLIANHNSVVQPDDIVYHTGDFAFCQPKDAIKILDQLNGKIHLIKGNHDRLDNKVAERFESISAYKEIRVPDTDAKGGEQMIVLLHYAMRIWNKSHHGSWHLYGHSHGSLPDLNDSLSFDCGVDSWNYFPVSYEQVKEKMKTKVFVPIDHHQ